ncbi:GIY-YIG nuclease family protein [Clostridium sp. UBA4395]|uniref:GIY-YIG nuclease family protein n=1 Tax=Clostridium sp. UBA4395 TaxID=1946360 RepID=UPI0032173512
MKKRKNEWYERNKDNPEFKEKKRKYFKNYYEENKEKWKEYNNKDAFICVYRLVGLDGLEILRVGSTSNLKTRIANYMSGNVINVIKLKEWFSLLELDRIEYILCSDRETAYLVEYNLIQRYNPKLNIAENLDMEKWDEDVEDLWQTWEGLDYYKCKYKAMCNEDL